MTIGQDLPNPPLVADPPEELDPTQDPFARESIEHLVGRYGSPLLVIDAERVRAQYRRAHARRCRASISTTRSSPCRTRRVIATLRDEGALFDLATNGEVISCAGWASRSERCIHTHPIKRDGDIRTALAYGVTHFVVDNPDELRKFVELPQPHLAPDPRRVPQRRPRLRSVAQIRLRPRDRVPASARPRGGSCASRSRVSHSTPARRRANPQMHVEAIEVCRELMRDARGQRACAVACSTSAADFRSTTCRSPPHAHRGVLRADPRARSQAIEPDVRVIAEPGRYIAAPAAIAVASVMGRAQRDGRWWYYLDDGLYGSYSGQMFDHATLSASRRSPPTGPLQPSVLAGPTCDSIDVIREDIDLPKLEQGDLVVGRVMGAYTWATATEFNFFPRPTVLALDRGRLIREGEGR